MGCSFTATLDSSKTTSSAMDDCYSVEGPNKKCRFYLSKKILGVGGFGIVQLVERRVEGSSECQEQFAMKCLSKQSVLKRPSGVNSVFNELKALILLQSSEYICNIKCAFQDTNFLYLVIEHVPGGDMRLNIRKLEHYRYPEGIAKFYACQLILAVSSCHAHNILHRGIYFY